jgi:hypothetical protein
MVFFAAQSWAAILLLCGAKSMAAAARLSTKADRMDSSFAALQQNWLRARTPLRHSATAT